MGRIRKSKVKKGNYMRPVQPNKVPWGKRTPAFQAIDRGITPPWMDVIGVIPVTNIVTWYMTKIPGVYG